MPDKPRTAEEARELLRKTLQDLPNAERDRLAIFCVIHDSEDTAEKAIQYFADILAALPDDELEKVSGLIDLDGREDRFAVVRVQDVGCIFVSDDRSDGLAIFTLDTLKDILKGLSGAHKLAANMVTVHPSVSNLGVGSPAR